MNSLSLSLSDLLGKPYVEAVRRASSFFSGASPELESKIELFPRSFADKLDSMLDRIGSQVVDGLSVSSCGAGTKAFEAATKIEAAPLTGLGFYRIGEDGRLYLTAKSEHYHTPMGHRFPGYGLLEEAVRLGILNATHNNTRGHITRLLERELVRTANGLAKGDGEGLASVMASEKPHTLNRVLNLETGSLAVEAALKMCLARFVRLDRSFSKPPYEGLVPVVLVMADKKGGREANYHGTTIFAQTLRGLWPDFAAKLEAAGTIRTRQVAINDIEDFKKAVDEFDKPPFKIAAFVHEIVLMNYGGMLLNREYLREAHAICESRDIPKIVDEIQSCMWAPGMFQFKEYGLSPDFVAIGKGFPGGQYCASKLILSSHMDNLNLFGALVTNGQEELASLAYLVTMAFAEENAETFAKLGDLYAESLRSMAASRRGLIDKIEGRRQLSTIFFHEADAAMEFCKRLGAKGVDISAQTYKADCPPSALTKIPLISSPKMIRRLVEIFDATLEEMERL